MMGLTAAAIRRHLDALTDDGLIEVRALGGQGGGRGRPARHYTVTPAGHAQISHTYDELAVDVLEYVKDAAGPELVAGFVEEHTDRLREDRKSTRLNSSHVSISYAVFCLKKKTKKRSTAT